MKRHCPRPKDWDDLHIHAEHIVGSFTFQHIIAVVACACTGVTLALSLWLIFKHLHRYTFPSQQRQIIRIVFTPVVFAVFSLLSIVFYSAEPYLTPVRDLYESFGIGAILLLFSDYVTPNYSTQQRFQFFDALPPPKAAYKRRYTLVFLYLIIATLMTIVDIASHAAGTYCDTSLSPNFANFWVTVIKNVAIAVAVTAVFRLYGRLKPMPEFSVHKPLLKLLSFKLIVGLNFIQDLVFNIITQHALIHGNTKVTGKDIKYGIPNLLVVIEQVGFAIFFHYTFRSREYHESELALKAKSEYIQRKSTIAAAGHAFNPYDLFEGMAVAVMNIPRLLQNRRATGGSGRKQYQSINLGARSYGNEQDQTTFLQPAPEAAYDRSRSPSPTPPYYQPPAGSPRGKYEAYRGAKVSGEYATGQRDVV